jgi:polyhydroxybutyrate depolymerase
MEGINYWVNRNACDSNPVTEQRNGYQLQSWKNVDGQPFMQLYLTEDGGHAWPSSVRQGRLGDAPSMVINATGLIWDFCNRFSLP